MKNLFVVMVILSFSFAVKASEAWSDSDEQGSEKQLDQDQLISAELNDEIQMAIGLKQEVAPKQVTPKKVVLEKPVTEESATLNLGDEVAAAEAKAHEAEIVAHKEEFKALKVAKVEMKKKMTQMKALKATKKSKALSAKTKPNRYAYFSI